MFYIQQKTPGYLADAFYGPFADQENATEIMESLADEYPYENYHERQDSWGKPEIAIYRHPATGAPNVVLTVLPLGEF